MLIKATRLHPGVPLQVYVLVMVGVAITGAVVVVVAPKVAITEEIL